MLLNDGFHIYAHIQMEAKLSKIAKQFTDYGFPRKENTDISVRKVSRTEEILYFVVAIPQYAIHSNVELERRVARESNDYRRRASENEMS